MTLLTHLFMLLFGLTPFAANRKGRFAAAVAVIVILAVFFGLSASVVRAAVMLTIVFGGELFLRKGSTLNSLIFALLLILFVQPYAISDAGLLMSFAGTFGVGVVAPAISEARKLNRVADSFLVSACASLCVLPVAALFFGGFSILAPLTSVIILPFFTLAVGGVILFAAFLPIPDAAQVFLLFAGIMSRLMTEILTLFGDFAAAWFALDYPFVPLWTALAIGAVIAVRLLCNSAAAAVRAGCIAAATLVLMTSVYDFGAVRGFNRERVYISIYSDSVSAWVQVRRGDTRVLIITVDTPRAQEAAQAAVSGNPPTLVVLLESRRNNETAFANLPARNYLPPDTEAAVFDINGQFTLDLRYTCEDEVVLDIDGFRLLFTRAANDSASPANVTVASGVARNRREFDADYVVYVGRTIPAEWGHNAYFEPLYMSFELRRNGS
jgi:ComEC/Rec2-related protein